jgi:Domain of unknown function (DUF3598)
MQRYYKIVTLRSLQSNKSLWEHGVVVRKQHLTALELKEFEIVTSKLVTEHKYQRLTAKYNNLGAFTMLISEVFSQY